MGKRAVAKPRQSMPAFSWKKGLPPSNAGRMVESSAGAGCVCVFGLHPEGSMRTLSHLFENNKEWAGRIRQQAPDFFTRLSRQQKPGYLWIGCSDSRMPANEIVGLLPGELLAVHGWIYGLSDGLLRDLNVTVTTLQEVQPVYQAALSAVRIWTGGEGASQTTH
jgi:hypothetical protein